MLYPPLQSVEFAGSLWAIERQQTKHQMRWQITHILAMGRDNSSREHDKYDAYSIATQHMTLAAINNKVIYFIYKLGIESCIIQNAQTLWHIIS